ncbi:penicillin-binding protein, 1A family [Kyrpidia tusciae DSM 2912]|uniref:Penicillin-binding protein, 1A family n=1 Tax=Kyrpidia tusciae (strain DSM 2912 / NBRC 15312 / T2) TaxID=562970 RepID=D5WXB0_KYRT2|nr:penicillin-binding protein, 1A family [Kyrpidia tusciae DSM 2912]
MNRLSDVPVPSNSSAPSPGSLPPLGRPGRNPIRRTWRIWLAAGAMGIGLAGLAVLYLRFAPLPPGGDTRPTVVYGADGSVIAQLYGGTDQRDYVPLTRIPTAMKEAVIASEDAQFYQHGGLNWRGILRALWVDIREGAAVQGGSTITQQLVKNLYLTQDRTWTRKIHEAILALQFEMHASKDEILERYLNSIYFGHGATGVGEASLTYFSKPVESLDLAQCALLAGLPRGPSVYDPIHHFQAAKERQKQVLEAMVRAGMISQAEADRAWREPVPLARQPAPDRPAPYFLDDVTRELSSGYDVPESALAKGGLSIYTTLDPKLQRLAEEAVARAIPKGSGLQAAFVALDPHTGDIKAWVGGTDYRTSSYDRVLAQRQPGSSFKPILYLTALHRGMTPTASFVSEPTTVTYGHGQTYEVHNYANHYLYRPVAMREAIARSDNVYAVDTIMKVGPQAVVEMARQLGITEPLQPYPSLALGAFPVSPLDLARAYAAIANGGVQVTPRTVREVLDPQGRALEVIDAKTTPVTDPQRTFILTDLMKSVFEPEGTGARVARELEGRPLAAKTGSTDTDAWMAGFSPNLVAVAWVGYDKDRFLSPAESTLASQIWADFMSGAVAPGSPDFPVPPGLVRVAVDPLSGKLATENCPRVEWDYFVQGTEPMEVCSLHGSPPHPPGPRGETRTPFDHLWDWFQGRSRR